MDADALNGNPWGTPSFQLLSLTTSTVSMNPPARWAMGRTVRIAPSNPQLLSPPLSYTHRRGRSEALWGFRLLGLERHRGQNADQYQEEGVVQVEVHDRMRCQKCQR